MGSFNRKLERRSALAVGESSRPVPEQCVERVETLRRMSIDARDFNVPLNYFHDHLAEDQRFVDSSERVENPALKQVIERTLQATLPGAAPSLMLMLRIGDFWHGLVMLPHFPAGFYYFEQEDLGLLAATGQDGMTRLVRFSVVALGEPPDMN